MLHTGLIAPIPELLERHQRERPDKVAYWDAVRSVTYAQLASRTASIAVGMSSNGVREGDRIAIYLPNGVDWIEACLAGLRAGAMIVPISYSPVSREAIEKWGASSDVPIGTSSAMFDGALL